MPARLAWLSPPSRALVIGINEYDAPYIPPLRGCVQDARAVAALLRTLGLPDAQCRLLTSPADGPGEQRATRAAIIAGVRDFLAAAPSGSEVLFYYSGHGSNMSPLAPALQLDGKPTADSLIPADTQAGTELLDLELRYLWAALAARGIRLTIIVDACHSGDIQRQEALPPPSQPRARYTGLRPVTRDLPSLLDGTLELPRLQALYEASYRPWQTLLAGCQPSERSYEGPMGGEVRGIMTTALVAALTEANGPMSYRELERAVRARSAPTLQQINKAQTPTVNGPALRALFQAEPVARDWPLFAVREVAAGKIRVEGSALEGLSEGSELDAFTDWSLTEPLGAWRVSEARSMGVWATPLQPTAPALQVGQPLRLTAPPDAPTIYFAPEAKMLAEQWRTRPLAPLTYLIESEQPEADYQVISEGDEWRVRRRDGSLVAHLRQSKLARRDGHASRSIVQEVDRAACFERFRDRAPTPEQLLALTIGRREAALELALFELDWQGHRTASLSEAPDAPPLPERAAVGWTLQNQWRLPLYGHLYLLDPQSDLAVRLWPPLDGAAELLPGQAQEGRFEPRRVLQQAGTTWRGGPLLLKLVASTSPFDWPFYPCGQRGHRGGTTVRARRQPPSGWATHLFTLGQPPAAG